MATGWAAAQPSSKNEEAVMIDYLYSFWTQGRDYYQ